MFQKFIWNVSRQRIVKGEILRINYTQSNIEQHAMRNFAL
jgi:hypothetical protein